jgi:hypothetical protein
VDVAEEEQPGRLVGKHRDRLHHRLGDEGQRPLGAHQDVGEDVDRPLEVDEGVEPVPGGVLHPVLRPDALHQPRVRADLVPEVQQSTMQLRLARPEQLVRAVGTAVDHRTRGQDEGQRVEGVVAVLLHPAAHPAGVVGQDAAERAGADARRVGTDLPPERAQELVQMVSDHSRTGADAEPVLLHPRRAPVPRHLHQQPIGERLA